jgi:hypothetical protein
MTQVEDKDKKIADLRSLLTQAKTKIEEYKAQLLQKVIVPPFRRRRASRPKSKMRKVRNASLRDQIAGGRLAEHHQAVRGETAALPEDDLGQRPAGLKPQEKPECGQPELLGADEAGGEPAGDREQGVRGVWEGKGDIGCGGGIVLNLEMQVVRGEFGAAGRGIRHGDPQQAHPRPHQEQSDQPQ